MKVLQERARHTSEQGSTEGYVGQIRTFRDYSEFLGVRAIREQEKQFVAPKA